MIWVRWLEMVLIFGGRIPQIGENLGDDCWRCSNGLTQTQLKSERQLLISLLPFAMSKFERTIKPLLYAILVISSLIQISECSQKPVGVARKEDIPFIKCQVCEKLVHQIYHQVQDKQSEVSPKKISEYQIIEISENVCNLKKKEADWILKIDIVEQGDRLELVEQDSEGHCNSECKTIERACQEVLGYSDTDVAEYLYKKKPSIDSLVKFLCKDLTGVCTKVPPKVPKNRVPGETFIPKSSQEAEMDKIMKSMEGMPGAPGMKMYSRDDLKNMQNIGDENADDDEDDDDNNESDFSAKLAKAVKDQESNKKIDWSQRIKNQIIESSYTLKKHAYKVTKRIKSWWNLKKHLLIKKMKQKKKNSKNNNAEL